GPQFRGQFCVISGRILHQIPGMHFEEPREQQTAGVRQMRTAAVLDLREIRLTDGLAQFSLDGAHHILLRHFTPEPAELPFDEPQIAYFLAQRHCNMQYTYCKLKCQMPHPDDRRSPNDDQRLSTMDFSSGKVWP